MATFTTRWGLRMPAVGDTINPSTDLGTPYTTIDAALGSTVCTSSTRPGSPVVGQLIWETDTERVWIWGGSGAGGWLPVGPLTAAKTADLTKTSSTSLSDDAQLTLPVAANNTYLINAFLIYDSATNADAKFGFTVPAGATWQAAPFGQGTGATVSAGSLETAVSTASGIALGGIGAGTKISALVTGTLVVGGTAGTCALSWAQNTSQASNTVLRTGSSLTLTRF